MLKTSKSATSRRGSRRQPEASREAILRAALVEFAEQGLAGARVDAIAEAAGVNKALLYYYFRDKDAIYGEVLDRFFVQLLERITTVCDQPGSAGERFLSYVKTHFDAIAESAHYAHIFMSEMMSASRGSSANLDHLFAHYLRPIAARILALLREGIESGEFRGVQPEQFVPSVMGCIVHYFLTAPLRRKFMHEDTSSQQSVHARRAAVLDFVAAALFTDREEGIKLAARFAAQNAAESGSVPSQPVVHRTRGKHK